MTALGCTCWPLERELGTLPGAGDHHGPVPGSGLWCCVEGQNCKGDVMSRQKRVVIIGAGPGGLAAAMLLARAGIVTVLELPAESAGARRPWRRTDFGLTSAPRFSSTHKFWKRSSRPSAGICGRRWSSSGSTPSTT